MFSDVDWQIWSSIPASVFVNLYWQRSYSSHTTANPSQLRNITLNSQVLFYEIAKIVVIYGGLDKWHFNSIVY